MDGASDPISVRYDWNAAEMAIALRMHGKAARRTVLRSVVIALGALEVILFMTAPIMMIVGSRSSPETRRNGAIILLLMTCLIGWLTWAFRTNFFLRWQSRRVFRSLASPSHLSEWSIDATELRSRTALSAATLLWPAFIKVVESPQGFLLYSQPRFFNWIPAHGFASAGEMARFAALARERATTYQVAGPCVYPVKPDAAAFGDL